MTTPFKIISFIFLIILISCYKDSESLNSNGTSTYSPIVYQAVNASVLGYVHDENNQPISDAIITMYKESTRTNKFGVFFFKNSIMDGQGSFIKVEKEGYFNGSDHVYPVTSGIANARIKLLKFSLDKQFNAEKGGIVELESGAKVIFPENAVQSEAGDPFQKETYANFKFLNPNDLTLGEMMQGGLVGDALNGNTVVVGTLGMLAVQLNDQAGKKLKLAKKATIYIPRTDENGAEAIPLWYFDENKGRWIEEGVASLQGNTYVGELSRFGFWNIGPSFSFMEVCGKVTNLEGEAIYGARITGHAKSSGIAYTYTQSDGSFCGKMPKGQVLSFTLFEKACASSGEIFSVGPFENNVLLDAMKLNEEKRIYVDGDIHCNEVPIENGVLMIQVNQVYTPFLSNAEGLFNINLSPFLCNKPENISAFAFDLKNLNRSETIKLDLGNTKNINLNVCASPCDLNAEFIHDCNEKVVAEVTSGNGNYTFQWHDNSISNVYNIMDTDSAGSLFCVTISDIDAGCSKTFCYKYNGKLRAEIMADCQSNRLTAMGFEGKSPYDYIWSNGSTAQTIEGLLTGTYAVTITDVYGCSAATSLNYAGNLVVANNIFGCKNDSFYIESSPFTSGMFSAGSSTGKVSYPIHLSIFTTGFDFSLSLDNGSCIAEQSILLPRLIDGLSTSVKNTTCSNCEDGKIDIMINANAPCSACKIGQTKILSLNDFNTDLSIKNSAGEMKKGTYYIVVTDKDTSCYIAFKKVVIQ